MTSVFPKTEMTRIESWIHDMDHKALSEYLWSVYHEPLSIYYRGCSRYDPTREPAEVVDGFLTHCLDREGGVIAYLRGWIERPPEPLRNYLINGLWFSMKTDCGREARDRNRRAHAHEARAVDDLESPDTTPMVAFDRAYIQGVVRYALVLAGRCCEEEGFSEHWDVFIRHAIHEQTYPEIGSDLGVSPERAAVMFRTGKRRFEKEFCGLVERDGTDQEGCEGTIQDYLEIIES